MKYIVITTISNQKIGEDIKYDRTVFHSAIKTTLGYIPSEVKREEIYPDLLNEIEKNDNLKNNKIIERLQIENRIIIEVYNDEISNCVFQKKPTTGFLIKAYLLTRKIHRQVRNEYHKKHIERLQIKNLDVPGIITFSSILFLTCGVLRAGMFAKSFGFHMDIVYGISDYVQASMVALSRLAAYLLFFIVVAFILNTEDSKMTVESRLIESKKSNREIVFSLFIFSVLAIIYGLFTRNYFNIFSQLIVFVIFLRLYTCAMNRYIENSKGFFFGGLIVILALTQVVIQTSLEIKRIKMSPETKKYIVNFEDDQKIEGCVVVSTSRYIVFWEEENERCRIYTNSRITYLMHSP